MLRHLFRAAIEFDHARAVAAIGIDEIGDRPERVGSVGRIAGRARVKIGGESAELVLKLRKDAGVTHHAAFIGRGDMMLALGLGGWLAGMMHLFTHAFFKSLLFLCSGSVNHACGTNEMPQMGGLRRKMPITAITMLIGCLAIAGAGIPTVIGLSGFKSKDMIVAQGLAFWSHNRGWAGSSSTRRSSGRQ